MQSSNELRRAIATAAVVATVMQNYGCATRSAAPGYVAQPRIAAPAELSLQHPPQVRVREADAEERRRLAAYPGASERQAQEVAEVLGTLPFLVVLWPFMLAELDPRSIAARNAKASALERERARIAKDLPPRLTEIIQQRFSAPQPIESNDVLDIAFVADRGRVQELQCWYLHVEVKLESPAGVSYRDAIYIDPFARSADAPAAACVESLDASGVFAYADAIPSMLERRLPGLPWQGSGAASTSSSLDASSVAPAPFAVRGTTYTNRPGGLDSAG